MLPVSFLAAMTSAVHADVSIAPAELKAAGTIDVRFQSYNIEMVEVTGGRFWKPYAQGNWRRKRYAYRPPIDLANTRLRKLAAALGPAYLRVSGTWANATFFPGTDDTPAAPPAGFNTVLSRTQWRGVVDFARAADAEIVTSFAVSPGSRDTDGAWTPDQAQRLVDFTRSLGSRVAAAEFMNEPTLAANNGAPAGYDANAYGRDFKIFRAWMKRASPETLIVGPGSVGDSAPPAATGIHTRALLAASGPGLDRVSYHHYNTLSPRCGVHDDPAQALSEDWFSRTDVALAVYRGLRDEFEPGKPIWLTETADAACGGNPWDATFLDTFRYLDQLGRLAKAGVQVVMHNTLAASDYGLLDERTFRPRPNYWAALLWHRLMGTTVLDAGAATAPGLHVYAHCHPQLRGAVTLLAINISHNASRSLSLLLPSKRYTLGSARLQGAMVQLNGKTLALAGEKLPDLKSVQTLPGAVRLAPATITFFVIPDAANRACL
jgi:Glycosyl hydrolase family 79, N-terminal domain